MIEKKIGIIGLGYVGLPLAVEFGINRKVLGFDINKKRISELKKGIDITLEVDTKKLKSAKHLEFTSDEGKLKECSIFIITVPTPINSSNSPDLTPLISASKLVGRAMKNDAIVIYESTVYPGCTEEICVPILELESGLKFNTDFYCGYSPERINPGDKKNTLSNVVKITSGSTPEISEIVDSIYRSIVKVGTFKANSIRVAEAAKVIENSQRDLNIAFVNELSQIFNLLNIDTIEVLEAAGSKWNFLNFRPGMVGGHCIGVDPFYLAHKAQEVGYTTQLILSARRLNDEMALYAAKCIIKMMTRNGININQSSVCVMGVTFKDNCPDIRNSKIFDLINELKSWGINVVVTDPWANSNEVLNLFGIQLVNINEIQNMDSIIVAVGHDQFKQYQISNLKKMCKSQKPVLADLKSIYRKDEVSNNGFTLFRL